MTIRLRLTLWYALALSAALSLFAATIWFSMRASLYSALDTSMADHGRNLALYLEHELNSGHPQHLTTELNEFSQGLPAGISIEVRNPTTGYLFRSYPQSHGRPHTITQHLDLGQTQLETRIDGSYDPANETLNRLRNLLFAATPLLIFIGTLGGYFLSRRALRPVTAIIDAAQTISIENLSQRLHVPQSRDELQRLAETWNAVLARLESAVGKLSQFTADASHELRTPLAVIRATAELAARRSRTPEAYRAALQDVVTEADRMTQMVEDLLFLARCDAMEMPHTDLDLANIVREACDAISPLAEAKSIAFTRAIEPTPISGNAAELRRLTLVLLENALKYTEPGGQVVVTLCGARLTVTDTGIGIPQEALPHIFDRFYQADPSRHNGGYGLGLAQAQSIAQRHNADIAVTSKPGQGSTFTVSFPAQPQSRRADFSPRAASAALGG